MAFSLSTERSRREVERFTENRYKKGMRRNYRGQWREEQGISGSRRQGGICSRDKGNQGTREVQGTRGRRIAKFKTTFPDQI